MKLNNIEVPDHPNRGRAFPYKDTGPHFAGPLNVDGHLKVIKVWRNLSVDGREYLRFVVESIEESNLPLIL